MQERIQIFIFFVVTSALAVVTHLLLGTATESNNRILAAFAGYWYAFPVRFFEKGLFAAVGTVLLYPVLLRPVTVAAYKLLPLKLRFVPRKFIAASNFRLFLFSLIFASLSGVLLGISSHAIASLSQITVEFVLGLWMALSGLIILNLQYQFAYIRSSLKRRDLLEASIAVIMLLTGFMCIGHAIVA